MSLLQEVYIYKNGLEISLTILAVLQSIYILRKPSTKNTGLLHGLTFALLSLNFFLLTLTNIFHLKIDDLIFALPLASYGPLSYFMVRTIIEPDAKANGITIATTITSGFFFFYIVNNITTQFTGVEYYWNILFIGLAALQTHQRSHRLDPNQKAWLMQYLIGFGFIFSIYLPVFYANHFYPDIFLSFKVPFTILFILFLINNFRHLVQRPQLLARLAAGTTPVANAITQFMNEHQPFLKFDFDLKSMAQQTGYSERQLSETINRSFHQNFNQFVNGFRVEAAVQLMTQDVKGEKLIKEIMYASGFNHKVSFNNAFRRVHHTTPTAYRKARLNSTTQKVEINSEV